MRSRQVRDPVGLTLDNRVVVLRIKIEEYLADPHAPASHQVSCAPSTSIEASGRHPDWLDLRDLLLVDPPGQGRESAVPKIGEERDLDWGEEGGRGSTQCDQQHQPRENRRGAAPVRA